MKRLLAAALTFVFAVVAFGGVFAGVAVAATYTVRQGDTLFLIGQRFGVSASSLKSANGLSSDAIYPGETLNIPGNTLTALGTVSYTVQRGDTLYLVAQKYGTTVSALKSASGLTNDWIYPGQVLKVPQRTDRPAATVSRDYSRSDVDLLARAVYAEARGETYEGQVAIAAVILNRVKNPNFPNSIAGVIYEPWAFSCVNDGQINLPPSQSAYKAAQAALAGWDPTGGALYYWNPATATSKWVWSRTIIKRIGNHVFAK